MSKVWINRRRQLIFVNPFRRAVNTLAASLPTSKALFRCPQRQSHFAYDVNPLNVVQSGICRTPSNLIRAIRSADGQSTCATVEYIILLPRSARTSLVRASAGADEPNVDPLLARHSMHHVAWWLSGRTLDLRFTGRGFNSRPVRFHVT